jgi:hypothetical protein
MLRGAKRKRSLANAFRKLRSKQGFQNFSTQNFASRKPGFRVAFLPDLMETRRSFGDLDTRCPA